MTDTMQKTAWGVRGSSTRGASHLRTGLPNQDSIGTWWDEPRSRAIVVVSDGHGSARHFRSDTGSRWRWRQPCPSCAKYRCRSARRRRTL